MNFKTIDYSIGILSGIFIAFMVKRIVPEHWSMIAGMILGHVCGMILHLVLGLLLLPFFGSFEVMVPLSVIGMLVGMTGGMAATHPEIPGSWIVAAGGMMGCAVTAFVRHSNKKLTGANQPCP